MTEWIDVEQLKNHLRISKETIYRMLKRKAIPFNKIGKQYRFDAEIIDKWMRGNYGSKRTKKTSDRRAKTGN